MIRKQVAPGIIQVTLDEYRWYIDEEKEKNYPSVTWILEYYPKMIGFHKYLASLSSYEESQMIMKKGGERGSKVHAGIEKLLRNEKITIYDIMPNSYEPFTPQEWRFILTFVNWFETYKPVVIAVESNVINEEEGYAGTIDLYCEINGEKWIIDWKTTSHIYESAKCQIASYTMALRSLDFEVDYCGIVRLGSRHKVGYEFWSNRNEDELQHYYNLFKSVKAIWEHENPDPEPRFINVQEEIQLNIEEVSNAEEKHQVEDNGGSEGKDKDGNEGNIRKGEGDSEKPRLL